MTALDYLTLYAVIAALAGWRWARSRDRINAARLRAIRQRGK